MSVSTIQALLQQLLAHRTAQRITQHNTATFLCFHRITQHVQHTTYGCCHCNLNLNLPPPSVKQEKFEVRSL